MGLRLLRVRKQQADSSPVPVYGELMLVTCSEVQQLSGRVRPVLTGGSVTLAEEKANVLISSHFAPPTLSAGCRHGLLVAVFSLTKKQLFVMIGKRQITESHSLLRQTHCLLDNWSEHKLVN